MDKASAFSPQASTRQQPSNSFSSLSQDRHLKWTYERKINVFLGVKPVHPAERGFTFENSALVLLNQGEKHSCSITDAAQGRRVLKRAE